MTEHLGHEKNRAACADSAPGDGAVRDRADRSGDHLGVPFRHGGQKIAQETHPAFLNG